MEKAIWMNQRPFSMRKLEVAVVMMKSFGKPISNIVLQINRKIGIVRRK